MAIFHHSTSIIKKSSGKSAISAAAYRSGGKLTDYKDGKTYDYSRKSGVDYSVILSPIPAVGKNAWLKNRSDLWNLVEAGEKRVDAQLAREVTIAIPKELKREDQIALVEEYIQSNYVSRGMIADVNFHNLDEHNPHVHVMLTMRELTISDDGSASFGNKNRSWNDKKLATEYRKNWEVIANKYLDKVGNKYTRIDCRTLEEQGILRVPQIHLGAKVSAMKDKGIRTDRGDIYNRIGGQNHNIRYKKSSASNMESRMQFARREARADDNQPQILAKIESLDLAIGDIDRQIEELELELATPKSKDVWVRITQSGDLMTISESGDIRFFINQSPDDDDIDTPMNQLDRGFER